MVTACAGSEKNTVDSIVAGDVPAATDENTPGVAEVVGDSTPVADTAEATGAPDTAGTVADTDGSSAQGLQQNQPVVVAGDSLDEYDGSGTDPAVGTTAPVIEGKSFDGTPITIGASTDNPTMVVFLAHWCPHCNREVPVLVGMNDDGQIPDGLDVVGVSTAVDADADNFPASDWIADNDWPWPAMADDEDLTAFGALGGSGFPYTVVLDTDGTVLARRSGEASADETVAFIDDALAASAA